MLFDKKLKAKRPKQKAFSFKLFAFTLKMAIIRQAVKSVIGNDDVVGNFYIQ